MSLRAEDILSYHDTEDDTITLTKIDIPEIVIPGETKRKIFIVRNNHANAAVELIPFSDSPNLVIERAPKMLGPLQSGPVELAFSIPDNATELPTASFGFDIILVEKETVIA